MEVTRRRELGMNDQEDEHGGLFWAKLSAAQHLRLFQWSSRAGLRRSGLLLA
jgi:hypothetical protein